MGENKQNSTAALVMKEPHASKYTAITGRAT